MKQDPKSKQPLLVGILAVGIFCIVYQGEKLKENNLLLPVLGLVMLVGLIWLSSMAIKSWKTPASEVLEQSDEDSDFMKPPASLKDRIKVFAGGLFFLATIHMNGGKPPVLFVGIILLITGLPVIGSLIRKAQGREGEPFFPNARFKPVQLLHLCLCLFGTVFSCFWCYLTIRHGIWFMLPFGISIGAFALRPLAAVAELLIRNHRDPGEKHVRNKKENDPWDRPDRPY